jgi:hypothetical protein
VPRSRGERVRPETFSAAALPVCLASKDLFGLALRQTIGMVASEAQGWPALTGRRRIWKRRTGQ